MSVRRIDIHATKTLPKKQNFLAAMQEDNAPDDPGTTDWAEYERLQSCIAEPKPRHARPRRAVDLGKTCRTCGDTFFRNAAESLRDYRERRTCGKGCRGIGAGDEVACANCCHLREDSVLGRNCGPCQEGRNFKRR